MAADVAESQAGKDVSLGGGEGVQVEGPLLVGHGVHLLAGRQVGVGYRGGFQPHLSSLVNSTCAEQQYIPIPHSPHVLIPALLMSLNILYNLAMTMRNVN